MRAERDAFGNPVAPVRAPADRPVPVGSGGANPVNPRGRVHSADARFVIACLAFGVVLAGALGFPLPAGGFIGALPIVLAMLLESLRRRRGGARGE